ALVADIKSANDVSSFLALAAGTSIGMYRNNPNGGTPISDNDGSTNNTTLDVTRANLKALGLLTDDGVTADGEITFSSNFSFDFDPTDGIGTGLHDFVGVAIHEMGHLFGFVSGVDTVDEFSKPAGPSAPLNLNPFRVFSVLDLFRYTPGVSKKGFYDFTTGLLGDHFFTIDGGTTLTGKFETGAYNGSGEQASHWAEGFGLGIMDPLFDQEELGVVTKTDLIAFDVIGWDIPEPSIYVLLGTTVLFLAIRRRKGKAASPKSAPS
ncbi:MAG: NF038122 family metalloprotease, partial [Planctomycetota bacterium]